jgi:hypothetical protein
MLILKRNSLITCWNANVWIICVVVVEIKGGGEKAEWKSTF